MGQQEKEHRVAELRNRRPWTESDARLVLDACASSGETLAKFARRMKLVPQRLQWWQRRLERPASQVKSAIDETPTFVPVVVQADPAGRASGEAAAVLVSGAVRVEVRELDPRSAAWVAMVARSLQEVRS